MTSPAPVRPAAWLWSINPVSLLLWPLSLLFCLLVRVRKQLYRRDILKSATLPVTVLVVGNISLGGNGKTPVVVALVKWLQQQGFHPGILSRGYKSDIEQEITVLADAATLDRAGDEANMLSELCGCPLAIGADRVRGGEALLEQYPKTDILVADDGLQHYALARDIEIIVQRHLANGNGWCLPAGPLREPLSRLQSADLVIDRDGDDVQESLGQCFNLLQPDQRRDLTQFAGQDVHALAGIGFPHLFFEALSAAGLKVQPHPFADHHPFKANDLKGLQDQPLLVTHKDAVKLRSIAASLQMQNIWVVPLELTLSDELQSRLTTLLETHHG